MIFGLQLHGLLSAPPVLTVGKPSGNINFGAGWLSDMINLSADQIF
jgi:hypothetical protein